MASKAGQSRAKFVFYDLNRHEITNKVGACSEHGCF
jgi:hypothetical protein